MKKYNIEFTSEDVQNIAAALNIAVKAEGIATARVLLPILSKLEEALNGDAKAVAAVVEAAE